MNLCLIFIDDLLIDSMFFYVILQCNLNKGARVDGMESKTHFIEGARCGGRTSTPDATNFISFNKQQSAMALY
ncbi:hypothetical protein L6452_13719 [Arctium lappa]|uniref:Uncharacterized protein n=1 Tax=Arctium lappa TaxID=4217 RepID=A0ACB9CJ22_ARCLA|nr:hypothetical protein L6452_13719 [Arctium lappa]